MPNKFTMRLGSTFDETFHQDNEWIHLQVLQPKAIRRENDRQGDLET